MEQISNVHVYWFLGTYFSIGFLGFYITSYLDEVGSLNGFFGDLFVAICWGLFWPMLLFAGILFGCLNWLEKKTGAYINFRSLVLCPTSSYLCIAGAFGLIDNFSVQNFVWALIFGLVAYVSFKNLHAEEKAHIPEFVRRDLDQLKKQHKERGGA